MTHTFDLETVSFTLVQAADTLASSLMRMHWSDDKKNPGNNQPELSQSLFYYFKDIMKQHNEKEQTARAILLSAQEIVRVSDYILLSWHQMNEQERNTHQKRILEYVDKFEERVHINFKKLNVADEMLTRDLKPDHIHIKNLFSQFKKRAKAYTKDKESKIEEARISPPASRFRRI